VRVDFSTTPPTLGMPGHAQLDIQGTGNSMCQNPSGIVLSHGQQKAYVNCWGTRRLAVIDLSSQTVSAVVDAVSPAGLVAAVDRGRNAFFTGRGRWSGNFPSEIGSAWSTCGSCHPDGLSDNITWVFNSGPRQTTSLDGSYSHSPGGTAQKQRVFNWTAINDEMHDFESITRSVSGGLGALTTSSTCGTLTSEVRATLPTTGLGVTAANQVARDLQSASSNCTTSFDDVVTYVQSVLPPRGRRFLDQSSVTRGAALCGGSGGCVKCHGGSGWTVSTRFYTPSGANNGASGLPATPFTGAGQSYSAQASMNTTQIAPQSTAADPTVNAAIPPLQLSCALRNVGTFGVPADQNATAALEVRSAVFVYGGTMTSMRAQGMGGYNVPSLYGLQLGAPFLHHGQAADLSALFTDTKWQAHWQAGNASFLTGSSAAVDRADLVNFLLSLDSSTTEQAVPAGYSSGCSCPGGAGSC
jgi:hypothetical protein